MLDRNSGRPSDKSILAGQVRPCNINSLRALFSMKKFELFSNRASGGDFGTNGRRRTCLISGRNRSCRFITRVGNSIEAGLNSTTTDRKVHCTVSRIDNRIRHWEWGSGNEFLFGRRVSRAVGRKMNRPHFSPAPVEDEERFLVFSWEFSAVAERGPGWRTWPDIDSCR